MPAIGDTPLIKLERLQRARKIGPGKKVVNGVPYTSTITGLGASSLTTNNGANTTAQTIVIKSPFFLTPGGEFWRKVTLSR